MKYHLWDIEAGSYIGQYTDEGTALATVKSLVDRYGPTYADELSLGRVQDDGTILSPLTGPELAALVVRQSKPVVTSTARKMAAGVPTAASGMRVMQRAGERAANRSHGESVPMAPKRGKESRSKRD